MVGRRGVFDSKDKRLDCIGGGWMGVGGLITW